MEVSEGHAGEDMSLADVQALIEQEQYPEALSLLDDVIARAPDEPRALFLFGHIMLETSKPGLAYHAFKQLSAVEPKREQVWINLGKCLDDLRRYDEAQACYRRALKVNPENIQAIVNMASSAASACSPEKAAHWANKALAIDHDKRSAHVSLGYAKLMQRDYASGWTEYEWGLGHTKFRDERIYGNESRWKGDPGRRVIIYGEQGLGDQIALAQSVPQAVRDSAEVVLDVAPKLKNLFARSFGVETHGDQFNTQLAWPYDREHELDARCSLSSLQRFYRNDAGQFSGEPYLLADHVRCTGWRAMLDSLGSAPKIGIAWTGGTADNHGAARSATLEILRPILEQDAVWIDLEYKDRSAEIERFDIKIHSFPWATQSSDYDDTAALVAELDLVIAVPTTVVHLAGALGVECWCMLNSKPHFMFSGSTPEAMDWYSSVRLFRREKDEWSQQVAEVAKKLREWNETRHIDSGRTWPRGVVQACL